MKSNNLNAKSIFIILNMVIFNISMSLSQIIYHDVSPDHTIHINTTKEIDLNNDGINDFKLSVTEHIERSTSPITHVTRTCIIEGIGEQSVIATNNGPQVFSQGDNIEFLTWSNSSNLLHQYLEYFEGNMEPVVEDLFGNFTGTNSSGRFLGLKFLFEGATHYAYLGINVYSDAIVIRDYAYNRYKGEAIQAGKIITSLSNNLSSHTNIKVINNSVIIDFDHNFSGSVDIINMQGCLVKSLLVQGKKSEVAIDYFPTGLYQVVVSGNEGNVVKKVFISSINN